MIHTPRSVGMFLHCGSVEKVIHRGRVEDCAYSLLDKFLHCGSVERVLCRGSMDYCADPFFGIKHHNDSFALEVRRSSYPMEVWRGSYVVEALMVVLIHFWVSSTIRIPTPWKRGQVPVKWKCG